MAATLLAVTGRGTATCTVVPDGNPPMQPAPAPMISPNGGSFTSAQSVTITDSVSGSSIFYTTDGSMPTSNSPTYSGSITVKASITITANAISDGN